MSDYMKEVERLSRVLEDIAQTALRGVDNEQIRGRLMDASALLAHIQRGVPEGNERDEWEAVVFTLMGHAASLYFLGQSDMPNWFYELAEKLARRHVDEALAARVREVGIQQRAALAAAPDQFRDAAKMMAAPAEVPMPEPIGFIDSDDDETWATLTQNAHELATLKLRSAVFHVSQMRTYGAACRAAGEAAGYERGLAEGVARTGLTPAEHDVLAERARQISAEGWTPEHDDEHVCDEIAAMACFYAMPPGARDWDASSTGYGASFGAAILPEGWEPKTGDRRRELIKAGALIIAEIERLDRAEAASRKTSWLCPNCPTPDLCLRIQGCDRVEIAR